MGRLGAGAVLGAAGLYQGRALGSSAPASWSAPPVLRNPNILVIMVDQLRPPMWLAGAAGSLSQLLPNITSIQNSSYNFGQYFVAATVCTPSRSALLTGLYAPQTAMYATSSFAGGTTPYLNTAFPTWGQAIAALNPAYAGNIWWFGKWHLSAISNSAPLQPYGFNTRTYPGGPSSPYNPSPDGTANEGYDGGSFNGTIWANDSMIAGDFIQWLQGQPSLNGQVESPWCATVSLVNPHDISFAPGWLQAPVPPSGLPTLPVYFNPPAGAVPQIFGPNVTPGNYENLAVVLNKPSLQYAYQKYIDQREGTVNDWGLFQNQYYWVQSFVDYQIGLVLNALGNSSYAKNTVIVFTSDHGEYAGSHGLHTKGFAAYDESLQVPFCVQFPGQTTQYAMNQMCSSVDFFGLICDLATGGSGQWALAYPDLANRQSMWSFLYDNASETRVAPGPVGIPYVMHTCDEGSTGFSNNHIVCVRTKLNAAQGALGAKLACYSNWQTCATYPDSSAPNWEFYDYNPSTVANTAEMGNNYSDTNNSTTLNTLAQYQQMLGTWGPPGTGLIASEINAPLIGKDASGNPLSQAQSAAQQVFLSFVNGPNSCDG
jgi:arylsulfatase A-like enzyme